MTEVSAGTLTDFLLARLGDDEDVARAVPTETLNGAGTAIDTGDDPWPSESYFAEHFTPARVLAECEAKRRIVKRCDDGRRPHHFPTPVPDADMIAWKCAACEQWVSEGSAGEEDCPVDWRPPQPILALLAAVYSDHPDFRPEWRT